MGTKFKSLRYFDWWLLLSLVLLMIVGIVAVYSAMTYRIGDETHTSDEYVRQLIWVLLSLICIIVVVKTPPPLFEILVSPAYVISLVLLMIVLAMPQIKGSSRWILIGPFRLQPAEFAKITTILMLARALAKPHLSDLQIILRALAIGIPPILLLLLQPDLGTTLIFWAILFGLLLFSDLPKYYIVLIISPLLTVISSFYLPAFIIYLLILTLVLYKFNLSWIIMGFTAVANTFIFLLVPFLWNSLKVYQQNRILTFLDPTRDPLGAGYQAIQSRIAIGSGQFQGKGFLLGTQKNLNFLPERHTDFIFSVISEEFGFAGAMLVILLFLYFLSRLVMSLKIIRVREHRLAIVGIIFLFASQIIINISINLGIFPTTGLTLPFISYGGSSLLANTIAVSIVLKYMTQKSFIK